MFGGVVVEVYQHPIEVLEASGDESFVDSAGALSSASALSLLAR